MNWINEKMKEFINNEVAERIPTALEEARTQGAQEALAKVEEWARNFPERMDAYDLLHHLQQLKDNKE